MSRDLEDVLREIGELSNIHADRKKLRANLREIRDHRLAYYNQSNEKELQAEFSDALFKILLLELDEEEEESIEIAELAYLGLGHIFRRPELPTPELYKRRLLQARSLAIECLEKMQLSDMFYLEENATDFIDGDEQLSDACNGIETDPRLSEEEKANAALLHKVLYAYLKAKYKN